MRGKRSSSILAVSLLLITAFIVISPVKAGILDLWQGKTEYTAQDTEQDNIPQVTCMYVFNNEIHSNYSAGTAYTKDASHTDVYEDGHTTQVKNIESVFPGYIGTHEACEFLEWNTKPDGTGTSYTSGANMTLINDTVLYGVWKSCRPELKTVYEYDPFVWGEGVNSGSGLAGASIRVELPNGVVVDTVVDTNNRWTASVPLSSLASMVAGEEVVAYQIERGKKISDPISVIIVE